MFPLSMNEVPCSDAVVEEFDFNVAPSVVMTGRPSSRTSAARPDVDRRRVLDGRG